MTLRKLWRQLLIILLFLMMWATGYIISIKIVLCVFIFFLGLLVNIRDNSFKVSSNVFKWLSVYLIANLFFTALSVIYGNPGSMDYLNVDFVEPILFLGIIFCINQEDFYNLTKVFVYVSTFLLIYMILGFFSVNGMLPISLPFIVRDYGGLLPFGLLKADTEFIQWLYFLIPGNILLFCFRDSLENKRIVTINFILSLVVVLISLKTAMFLVVAFSLVISFLFQRYYTRGLYMSTNKLIITLAVIVIVVFAWFYFDLGTVFQNYIVKKIMISFGQNSYTNSYGVTDSGGKIRTAQIRALLNSWKEKPILGWGVGADAKEMIRSEVHGAYEMTYFAKLMQRGLVGMSIYIFLIGWMLKKLLSYAKANVYKIESLYVFVGLSAMLVANGTNPYIEAFDKLIILFFPLLIINLVAKIEISEVENKDG